MKRGFNILLLLLVVLVGFSCNKTRSYTDMLNDQERAINDFMDRKGFSKLSGYPRNGEFREGEYVYIRASNGGGIYLHVIDSGRGEKAVMYETQVLCRLKGQYLINDTMYYSDSGYERSPFNFFPIGNDPMEFTYGMVPPSMYSNFYLSEGTSIPLDFVRDSAVVSIIVEFPAGSTYAQTYGDPLYIERLTYLFYK